MNDRAFSLSFFRAFTHYELLVSFRSLNFGCKINRINTLPVIISSKLPAITNVMQKILWVLQTIQTTIKNYKVPHLQSADLNRIQVTTLTCCNIQVTQHYCTMLATATGNCDVTNVTYMRIGIMSSRELSISSPRYTCAHASDYVSRQIAVMCHIACWFRSGPVLKFDQFYHSSFFYTKLRLVPS